MEQDLNMDWFNDPNDPIEKFPDISSFVHELRSSDDSRINVTHHYFSLLLRINFMIKFVFLNQVNYLERKKICVIFVLCSNMF